MSQNVCLMDLSYGPENVIFVQTKTFYRLMNAKSMLVTFYLQAVQKMEKDQESYSFYMFAEINIGRQKVLFVCDGKLIVAYNLD